MNEPQFVVCWKLKRNGNKGHGRPLPLFAAQNAVDFGNCDSGQIIEWWLELYIPSRHDKRLGL